MKIASLDIGVRHLASVLLDCKLDVAASKTLGHEELQGVEFSVGNWVVMDVIQEGGGASTAAESKAININKTPIDTLVEWFICALKKNAETLLGSKEDPPQVVFLEQQPVGRFAANVKTKTLSHILQAFCFLHYQVVPKIIFVSPHKKLQSMSCEEEGEGERDGVDGDATADGEALPPSKRKYRENKKYAKTFVEDLLEDAATLTGDASVSTWLSWYTSKKGKKDDLADAMLQGIYSARDMLIKQTKKKRVTKKRKAAEEESAEPVRPSAATEPEPKVKAQAPRKRAKKAIVLSEGL